MDTRATVIHSSLGNASAFFKTGFGGSGGISRGNAESQGNDTGQCRIH
jgi:hypothetical protein